MATGILNHGLYTSVKSGLILLILCFMIPMVSSAQSPRISVLTSQTQVGVNEYFQVTVTIEGGEPQAYRQPNFGGLEQSGNVSTSSQMSIVNGRTSQKKSFMYTLVGTKKGKYTIGRASCTIKGRNYGSPPVTITVKDGARKQGIGTVNTPAAEEEVFIRMELSDSIAFIGQQVTLKYTIYTKSDIRSLDFIKEDSYDGFFINNLRNYRDKETTVSVNGKNYTKKTIRTYAIFPQRTGVFQFDAASLQIGIPTSNSRKTFFRTTNLKKIRLTTNASKIIVKSTPPNAPSSFSGAIGSFRMSASIDKRSLTTDDAFTVTMTINGKGDGRFLQAPPQPESSNFDYYDPNVTAEKASETGDRIKILKSFEYLIVPNKVGNFRIRPEFSYFDIDSMKYKTLYAGPYSVRVAKGTGSPRLENINKEEELAGPILSTSITKGRSFFLFSWGYFLSLLGVFGYLGFVLFQKRNQKIESAIDPNEKRRSAANQLAQKRLAEAKAHLGKTDNSFFDTLYNGLFGYIADKLLIPASQLNKDDIAQKLSDRNVSDELAKEFNALLAKCQMAIYGVGASLDKGELYERSVKAITDLEASLNG